MKTAPLLNIKQVAKELGYGRNYITAMIRAGYTMPYPGRTTRAHALKWLGEHPNFVAAEWLTPEMTKKLRKKAKLEALARPVDSAGDR